MQKYHDEPKQYKGYLKSALTDHSLSHESEIAQLDVHNRLALVWAARARRDEEVWRAQMTEE